jgi:hypothetical protein
MALSIARVLEIVCVWMFRPCTDGCGALARRALGWLGRVGPASWLGGLGVGVLLLALRWNSLDMPLVRDEGEYAYAAQILQSGLLPYEHAFLQKPPMVVYTYALAEMLAPSTYWFPRVLACVFAGVAACLLGLIARLEFGPGHALPAAWLITPMLLFPGLWQFTANTEMFMLVPLLATVALYVLSRHRRGPRDCWHSCAWALAGLTGAIALWYKYTAVLVLAVVFVAWSLEEWSAGRSVGRLLRCWGLALLGAGIASLAALGPFLARDGARQLWDCTVVFNRYYRESASFGVSGLLDALGLFWADWWILFLLLGVLLFRPQRRMWFWLGLFLAAWVSSGASALGHYYLLVMPFWALLAAVAINQLSRWTATQLSWSQLALRGTLTAVVVLLLCLPDLPWIACSKQHFAEVKAGGGNPFIESPIVAQHLARLTKPTDRVFVAGSEPQVLFYAKRLSATRFVIVYPLMIPTPLAQGYQAEATRELARHPPAAIVLAQSPLSWLVQKDSPLEFMQYVEKLIAERYELAGGWVKDGQGARWQESVTPEERPNCSLVLFRRKG